MPVQRPVRRLLPAVVLLTLLAALLAAVPAASAKTVWLCRPGMAHDPCTPGRAATLLAPDGTPKGEVAPHVAKARPKIDCFYVYPTVSSQSKNQATRRIDPEERSIALYQAAGYQGECRIFAPMYRQITIAGLFSGRVTNAMQETAYGDVRNAFRDYLKRYNKGRGIVFIGHSQGSFVLRRLLAEEVDRKAAIRRRLVSAILLGGNVVVKKGSDRGGDFRHIRACRAVGQTGCVIAFSTYNQTPPAAALFGRATRILGVGPKSAAGYAVLCTNPAALGGGSGPLDALYPSAPFAPKTAIGLQVPLIGFPLPKVATPWISLPGAYTGQCSSEGGAHVLRITGVPGAPVLKPLPTPEWGLHLADANIALGNLIGLVGAQATAYVKPR